MNRYNLRTLVLEIFMIVLAVVFLSPAFILINVALKPESDTTSGFVPTMNPTLDNIVAAWTQGGLGAALLNSLIVTAVSSLTIIALASFASYALARLNSKLSTFAFGVFLAGLLLPLQLATLPLYTLMKDLGLLGSLLGLIVVYSALFLPFSIFLFTLFMRTLPAEYEEAAAIDGCGPFRTFLTVVMPLSRPITATVVILNGISMYNDFFTPLLYLSGSGQQTAPVAINSFVGQYTSDWSIIFGGLLVAAIPALVVYFVLQRNIINGFAGGLKG